MRNRKERGHPIYLKYEENPTYIPETNLEVRGEPADILVVRGRTTQSPECSAGLSKIGITTAPTLKDAGTRL